MRILSLITSLLAVIVCCSPVQAYLHCDLLDKAIRSKKWIPYHQAVTSFELESRQQRHLIGKVQKLMARRLNTDKPDSLEDPIYQFFIFDRNGRLIQDHHCTYKYDKAGRWIGCLYPDGSTSLVRDKAGRVVERRGGGTPDVFEYDSKGRLSKCWPSINEAMFSHAICFNYDDNDRIISVRHFGGFDVQSFDSTYSDIEYRGNTVRIGEIEYTYDDKKRLVSLEISSVYAPCRFKLNLNYKKSTYKYNAQGLLAEQEDIDFDGKTTKIWYTYDSYSNLVKLVKQSGENKLEIMEEYAYKYDKCGNWIEKITLVGSESSTRRTIIYYD